MKGENRRSSVVPLLEGIELKVWGDRSGKISQYTEPGRKEGAAHTTREVSRGSPGVRQESGSARV